MLKSNQQVIQWLNKELNDAQTSHRSYAPASSFGMNAGSAANLGPSLTSSGLTASAFRPSAPLGVGALGAGALGASSASAAPTSGSSAGGVITSGLALESLAGAKQYGLAQGGVLSGGGGGAASAFGPAAGGNAVQMALKSRAGQAFRDSGSAAAGKTLPSSLFPDSEPGVGAALAAAPRQPISA